MIYFLRHGNNVKIGHTAKIATRMQTLQKQYPGAVLIKSITGSVAKEKSLHRLYSAHRKHGEWFDAVPALLSAIDAVPWSADTPANFPATDILLSIGRSIRTQRIKYNLTQSELAAKAGVSLSGVRHLEAGSGCSLRVFASTLIALDRKGWIDSLMPYASINPLHMTKGKRRQRVRH